MRRGIRSLAVVVVVTMAALLLDGDVVPDTRLMPVYDEIGAVLSRLRDAAGGRELRTGKVPAPIPDRRLQAELEEYVAGRSGKYGVAIRDLDTGQTVLINADDEFLSASTYKVLVMYRVYQDLEAGRRREGDTVTILERDTAEGADSGLHPGATVTVADALRLMIAESSNTAAYALTRVVGGWDSINAAAAERGMSRTGQGEDDYFETSPADMLSFFTSLAHGDLVGEDASRRMIQLLIGQTKNDRIPALLPAGTIVAHKTGELPRVRNDAGIVYGPGGRYAIAVFSREANVDEATEAIAHIARRAYDEYAR